MLYERLVEDKINRAVLVLEDTVSFDLTRYWTVSLDAVAQHAPDDWGIIQLAYRCDGETIARVQKTLSAKEQVYTSDCFYVEKRVFLDEHSPYVPWCRWHTSLACAYLIHPRAYKTFVKKSRQTLFRFDRPVEEAFFPFVNTYTFHRPMFTVQLDTRAYPYDNSRQIYERQSRLVRLVKEWHRRWQRALQQT
jgi:GR25 family glycosyltransferase involved in LPS biosynthesis